MSRQFSVSLCSFFLFKISNIRTSHNFGSFRKLLTVTGMLKYPMDLDGLHISLDQVFLFPLHSPYCIGRTISPSLHLPSAIVGVMTILILLAFRISKIFQSIDGIGLHAGGMESERAPLLPAKDDDISSWGSSYDSVSHDEEVLEEWLAKTFPEGKPSNEGESNNTRLCVVCFDAPRDCFFLPCGHCATCFTCGTR